MCALPLVLSLDNSWCQSFDNGNAREQDFLANWWHSWIVGKWFDGQTQFMEHITIVWIPPGWIPQCQEMVVDEWCHQTGTTTGEMNNKFFNRLKSNFLLGLLKKRTYTNTKMMTSGINRISDSAAKRKIFDVWSSTSEIINRAPHHEFWPSCYKTKRKSSILWSNVPIFSSIQSTLTSNNVSE